VLIVCNGMILMKLWPEIRDAHEGFWGLCVWYCFIGILTKCMNIMDLCTGYDVIV